MTGEETIVECSSINDKYQDDSSLDSPMSDNDSYDGRSRKELAADREVIKTANELLNSLEQSHRSDLTLHLYSSYLLKTLLYRANDRRHPLEVDQFVKTQIRDNWTSWPDPKTVVNPQTDTLYEDSFNGGKQENGVDPGEISPRALARSTNMLNVELDSHWQHCLAQSSATSGLALDVDKMAIPSHLTDHILGKLDHLFSGLHNKVAAKNKIAIQQGQSSQTLTVSQMQHETVKANKRVEFTYHDIIARGCEMGEDMVEIYMKSLELFNDIPSTFDKSQFKLPKSCLKHQRPVSLGKSGLEVVMRSKEQYLELGKLLKDKRLSAKDKSQLKKVAKKSVYQNLGKKTFFNVQSYRSIEQDVKDDGADDDSYNLNDCLPKIPRLKR